LKKVAAAVAAIFPSAESSCYFFEDEKDSSYRVYRLFQQPRPLDFRQNKPWVARIYHPLRMQCICDARITGAPSRNAAIDTRYPMVVFFNSLLQNQPDF
jgi:hypothetical protein